MNLAKDFGILILVIVVILGGMLFFAYTNIITAIMVGGMAIFAIKNITYSYF